MADTLESAPSKYLSIAVSQIAPSRHQARKSFNDDSIKALAESMKAEGLMQAITVRQILDSNMDNPQSKIENPKYELVSGERRLRAAKLLGWEVIDAKVIQTVSEAESAAKGLVENLQREDLNPIEEAEGFKELNSLDHDYWNQEQIAKIFGKTQGYISQSFNLLKLPGPIIENIRRLIISRTHGMELCRLETPEQQIQAAEKAKDLTAKQTRALVDTMLKEGQKGGAPAAEAKPKVADPLDALWKKLAAEKFKPGAWAVGYPKEDQWVIHLKPNREDPLRYLIDLLDSLSMKITDYKNKLDDAKEAAASHKKKG